MVVVAAVGGGAFVLAACVLGSRLLWLSRRTRALPEFAIGLGLFLMGGMGYPLTVLARHATSWSDESRATLILVNELCSLLGMTAVALFNWRVFRPDSLLARAAVAGIALAYAGFIAAQGATVGWAGFALTGAGPWNQSISLSILTLGWAGWESLRYHMVMRRRQRIGLADAVLVDRFRLWALGILTACAISLITVVMREMGLDLRGSAVGALVIGPLGLLAAGSMWLAFLPPAAYTRWVAGGDSWAQEA
jgi:hypothetical protein